MPPDRIATRAFSKRGKLPDRIRKSNVGARLRDSHESKGRYDDNDGHRDQEL